jgi:hypothetical protein
MSHGQQRKYNRRVAAARRCIEEKHGQFNIYEKPTQIKRIFSISIPQKEIKHYVELKNVRREKF